MISVKVFSLRIKHLKEPLSLQGTWKVALTEIYITESSPLPYKKLYLYSNICGDSIVAGEYHPLLRRLINDHVGYWRLINDHVGYWRLINDHVGYWAEIYELPNYVPVKRSEITDIEFYIKDEAVNYTSLLTNPVSITLYFRSFPFYHERWPYRTYIFQIPKSFWGITIK